MLTYCVVYMPCQACPIARAWLLDRFGCRAASNRFVYTAATC